MLTRSRTARILGLVAVMAIAGPAAIAQVPGRTAFAREPRSPIEIWEFVDYLILVGQAEQAAPYVKKFLDSKPDDATLLKVRDEYGVGSVLRLSDDPSTRPYARTMAKALADASSRHSTDPDRINRAVAELSMSKPEQSYAVDKLREAGPAAIPAIVRELSRSGLDPSIRAPMAENLGRLDSKAVPPLIATLDSPDARLVADAARALGDIGDPRALPSLIALAARREPESAARPQASDAIRKLTGRGIDSQYRSPTRVLSDEARLYHLHTVKFPGDPVVLWMWDPATNLPVARTFPVKEAEGIIGMRFAREALALDPTDIPAQVNLVSLALDHDPVGSKAMALASGAEVLGRVVRTAIADGRNDLAAVALPLFAQVSDRNALVPEGRANPLVEALSAPDRRVQFAAAEGLMKLDPRRPFLGSSRLVPVVSRFVGSQTSSRAIVVDGNARRGTQAASYLRLIGYDAQVATTGAKAFAIAATSADVELIVVDPHFIDDPWGLPGLMGNLKADGRTSGIPVFLVGPLDLPGQMAASVESFPDVKFLVTPTETKLFKRQIDLALASTGTRPFSEQERSSYAKRAANLLAEIARHPGSPFEADLTSAEPSLALALGGTMAPAEAAAALGNVPGADAQRSLGDAALDASRSTPIRIVAAENLARHLRRFGPKLASDQERRLIVELNEEPDPGLRDALAAVVGALKPGPDASGSKLQTYQSATP